MNPSPAMITGLFFAAMFLLGIRFMNSPKTAVRGNFIGALAMLGAIVTTLAVSGVLGRIELWGALAVGGILGYWLAIRATMIKMPQIVALLNGFGGLASAVTAIVILTAGSPGKSEGFTAALALAVGAVTFSGSMIAAAKLDRRMSQKPFIFRGYTAVTGLILALCVLLSCSVPFLPEILRITAAILLLFVSLGYGVVFAARIGGADMPITISLLNSLSGVAGSIAGFAIRDPLLVMVGAIVGSAGLILTRIMCRAMNRSLLDIIAGKTSTPQGQSPPFVPAPERSGETAASRERSPDDDAVLALIRSARRAVIVPGYGMALSQAQHQVKALFDLLERSGKDVVFAIHPVAGRMPGHMNVLLAEADVPYEKLCEMDTVNPMFGETDLVIVVGANDVVNPAANTAEGTPIYGMPILLAYEAKTILVFNKDTLPGYAGVDNPLYTRYNVFLFPGDAKERLGVLIGALTAS